MKMSDIVSAAGLTIYPRIALVLFLFAFVVVLVRLASPGAKARYHRLSRLPLDDVNDRFTTTRPPED